MNLGAIAEVAIGIIFVWIVLSLTTIQIQEWISSRLDKRATDMEASIHEMLANPNLKSQFYDHPVIRGLTAKKRKAPSVTPAWFYRWPIVRGFTKEKRKLPSYIPAQQFALAMFDIALTAGTKSSVIQQGILKIRDELRDAQKMNVHEAVIEELNLLSEFARSAAATEARTAITLRTPEKLKTEIENFLPNLRAKLEKKGIKIDPALEEKIKAGLEIALQEAEARKKEMDEVISKQSPVDADTALGKLRRGIAALSVISPEVNQTLSALLLNVEDYAAEKEERLARARASVEKWFNDAMDRVSGVYKRYSQNMALIIGLLIALFANVDSINLTLYLWREPAVRQALANQASRFELSAQQLEANPEQAMQSFRNQFEGLNLPVGWTFKDLNEPMFAENGARCTLFPKGGNYFGISFPTSTFISGLQNKCFSPAQPDQSTNLLVKLLGIIITAIAARQGAPFWFDILKRVVNIRSTGANPAEKEGKA
jgi:hypothetical protein